jgi:hypothetical protein
LKTGVAGVQSSSKVAGSILDEVEGELDEIKKDFANVEKVDK